MCLSCSFFLAGVHTIKCSVFYSQRAKYFWGKQKTFQALWKVRHVRQKKKKKQNKPNVTNRVFLLHFSAIFYAHSTRRCVHTQQVNVIVFLIIIIIILTVHTQKENNKAIQTSSERKAQKKKKKETLFLHHAPLAERFVLVSYLFFSTRP